MSDALLKNTFNKISPAYELVADVTVGVATTQVDFSGLNFGKDDDLLLVADVAKTTSSDRLFVNGNNTSTNYYTQTLRATGTSITAYRGNDATFGDTAGGGGRKCLVMSRIKLANSGYFTWQSSVIWYRDGTTPYVEIFEVFGTSTFTSTSITSLSVVSPTANDIPVGSRFQLYRLKAKKVADIIVGSATTQVDITGLSIDKDSEYMLVSDVVNAVGANMFLKMQVNDNSIDTNYWYQALLANSTLVLGGRGNDSALLNITNSKKSISFATIKLTHNGYVVYQSNVVRDYGDSAPMIEKDYGTSTFTMTSITKLSIKANITNAIGIGSRFTLYKMR